MLDPRPFTPWPRGPSPRMVDSLPEPGGVQGRGTLEAVTVFKDI
jgi:hypothetical protein